MGSEDPGAETLKSLRTGRLRGMAYALAAAVMFGGSTPFVRPALEQTDSAAAAGYLYLGQAVFLGAWWIAARRRLHRSEADLDRRDLVPLLAGIVAGGLVAPGAFTAGLARVPAYQVSLLLGLEIVFTLLIALLFRHERLDRRSWRGVALLIGAGILVSLPGASDPGPGIQISIAGSMLVAFACLGWAVDSNVTAGIAGKDPTAIALLKGWAAAGGYLGGCLLLGRGIQVRGADLLVLLAAGAIGYGLSLRFFILALRHLGAALTTALFSTAPIAGFTASVLLFGERPPAAGWIAFALAAAGVAIVARGGHDHAHVHDAITHEHPHRHDEHHQHDHPEGIIVKEGHSHVHTHSPLVHGHPHEADIHHAHRHD